MDSQDLKDINEGRVDSRLSRVKVTHPTLPLERTFCAFCGKPKGWVSHESSEFIEANNVVVVCDDCNAKFEAKLGKLDAPVKIPEYNLQDAEYGWDDAAIGAEWVENCIDCHVPMVKLQMLSRSKALPIMDTLRTGETVINAAWKARIAAQAASATPSWYCRKCHTLWGAIDQFWCKFRKL